jgi:hypothetical protein
MIVQALGYFSSGLGLGLGSGLGLGLSNYVYNVIGLPRGVNRQAGSHTTQNRMQQE